MSSNGGWWQPPTPPPPGPRFGPPMGPPPGQWPGAGPTGPWGHVPPPPKPGVIPLRPLSIGDIISGIFMTIRYNFLAVYGLPLLTALATVVFVTLVGAIEWSPLHTLWTDAKANADVSGWRPSNGELTNAVVALATVLALMLAGALATFIAAQLSGTVTLRHAVVGRRVTFRQAVRDSLPHVWRMLGATLLMMLITVGGPIGSVLIGVIVGLAGSPAAGLAIGFLLYFCTFFWGFYAQVRLQPLPGAVVLEGQGPLAAVKRTWRLNAGSWWRTTGTVFLISLITSAIGWVVSMPLSLWAGSVTGFGTVVTPSGDPAQLHQLFVTELLYMALVVPVGLLLNLLTLSLQTTAQGLMYIDRRIRRESLDVKLAEEAGYHFHAPQPAPTPQHTPPPAAPGVPPQATAPQDAPAAPQDTPPEP